MSKTIFNSKLIKKLASYSNYNFKNNLTLINIAQELFNYQPDLFPIKQTDINELQQKIIKYTNIDPNKTVQENINAIDINNLTSYHEPILKRVHTELKSNNGWAGFSKNKAAFVIIQKENKINKNLPNHVLFRNYFYAFKDNKRVSDKDAIIDYTDQYDLFNFIKQLNQLDTKYQYYIVCETKNKFICKNLWQNGALWFNDDLYDKMFNLDSNLSSNCHNEPLNLWGLLAWILDTTDNYMLVKLIDNLSLRFVAYTINNAEPVSFSELAGMNIACKDDQAFNIEKLNPNNKQDQLMLKEVHDLKHKLNDGILQLNAFANSFVYKTTNSKLIELIKAFKILQILAEVQDKPLKFKDDSINQNIIQMIYEQSHNLDIKTSNNYSNKSAMLFSATMTDFLSSYHIADIANVVSKTQYTLLELVKYMYDLIHHLPVDQKMFNLINSGNTNLNSVYEQAINLHLQNKLEIASKDESDKILSLMPTDISKNKHNKFTIYQINSNYHTKKYDKSELLIHGTKDYSVLNILGQGLIDTEHLVKGNYDHYSLTGNGLGNGIYFARINQMQKSLNYTQDYDSQSDQYLFICQVYYNTTITTNYYNASLSNKADLIIGKGVGSYDRDELVAQRPNQVELKYLIKITHQ